MSHNQHPKSTLGSRLKAFRKSKKLTQVDIANYIGVTKGFVSHIENNRNDPTIKQLKILADILDCDLHELITGRNKTGLDISDLWPGNQLIVILAIAILRRMETLRDQNFSKWWKRHAPDIETPEPPWLDELDIPIKLVIGDLVIPIDLE